MRPLRIVQGVVFIDRFRVAGLVAVALGCFFLFLVGLGFRVQYSSFGILNSSHIQVNPPVSATKLPILLPPGKLNPSSTPNLESIQ